MNGWTAKDMPDQRGRVVVITGANSGLGFESAVAFARKGAQVVMACRSMDKAEIARQALFARVPGALVDILPLDLGNLQSVRAFADRFSACYDRLDILMNNAGVMALAYGKSKDGFEAQFGTNHLGHFALTGLLLPMLLATPKSRVVSVSSSAYYGGRINFDDLQGEKHYSRWGAYAQSKLANVLFARQLQHHLEAIHADTLSVACHPGYTATNLQSRTGNKLEVLIAPLGNALIGQSAERGATYQLYAAVAPEVHGGEFYGPKHMLRGEVTLGVLNARARNDADAARLWTISEGLTGVRYESLAQPVLEFA